MECNGGVAAQELLDRTGPERRSLSAREAAKPQEAYKYPWLRLCAGGDAVRVNIAVPSSQSEGADRC